MILLTSTVNPLSNHPLLRNKICHVTEKSCHKGIPLPHDSFFIISIFSLQLLLTL